MAGASGGTEETFDLNALRVDGRQFRVGVKPSDTIEDVKINLATLLSEDSGDPEPVRPERLRLLSAQQPLDDDLTVAECGLALESIVTYQERSADGSGVIDYTISGGFPKGTSADWNPPAKFQPVTPDTTERQRRMRRILCEFSHQKMTISNISEIEEEKTNWTVIEPDVSAHELFFRISLPDKGNYECAVTGVRWEITKSTTINYRYCSWHEYAPIIVIKKAEFSGPLFNIVAEDSVITAIHLPHFICLKGKDRKIDNTFAIFHVKESSYSILKPSEIHQAHVELQMPTFSLMGVIVDRNSWFSFYSLAMIYQTANPAAVILHVYIIPNDLSIMQAVLLQESESVMIKHPSPTRSLYFGRKYSLISSSDVQIIPEEMKFHYIDMELKQSFFEVIMKKENYLFELKLTKRKKSDPLWNILLSSKDGKVSAASVDNDGVENNEVEFSSSESEDSICIKDSTNESDEGEKAEPETEKIAESMKHHNVTDDSLLQKIGLRLSVSDSNLHRDHSDVEAFQEIKNLSANIQPIPHEAFHSPGVEFYRQRAASLPLLCSDAQDTNMAAAAQQETIDSRGESEVCKHRAELCEVITLLEKVRPSHYQLDGEDVCKPPSMESNFLGKPAHPSGSKRICKYRVLLCQVRMLLENLGMHHDQSDEDDVCKHLLEEMENQSESECKHSNILAEVKSMLETATSEPEAKNILGVAEPCEDATEDLIADQKASCHEIIPVPGTIPDSIQEQFLSIQKVIKGLGNEGTMLCDIGTQTETIGSQLLVSDKDKQAFGERRTLFNHIGTQTEETTFHQTDSDNQALGEKTGEEQEILQLPNLERDKSTLKEYRALLLDSTTEMDSTESFHTAFDKYTPGNYRAIVFETATETDDFQSFIDLDRAFLQNQGFVASDIAVQTENLKSSPSSSDVKSGKQCTSLGPEICVQMQFAESPELCRGITDVVCYFEKEHWPCRIPKIRKDKLKWIIINPTTPEGANGKFCLTLPGKGHYECAETGLRWESKSNARIFYEYSSWDDYISDVQRECWIIGGPLFNIDVSYGDIAAVHLPHFICESGSGEAIHSARYCIVCLRDDTFVLENPSEIHLSYVVQRNQPLTLMGVILGQVHQVAIHAIIMIYQTFRVDCSILHVYVLPNDGSLIQAVDLQEKEIKSLKVQKPPQIISVYYGKKYRLTSFSNVTITPLDIKLGYFRYKQKQPFYEVHIQELKYSIKLCLTERSKLNVLWEILLRPDMFKKLKRCVEFVQRHKKEIICCLKTIQPILLHLRDTNIITKSEESDIVAHIVKLQQNKALLQLVMNKGEDAEDELYKALLKNNSDFVKNLEVNYLLKLCNNCIRQFGLTTVQPGNFSTTGRTEGMWFLHVVCIIFGIISGFLLGYRFS